MSSTGIDCVHNLERSLYWVPITARWQKCVTGAPSAGLRYVATALLNGTESSTLSSGNLAGGPTVESAIYLRDRVGVPRDLPLPAARQLRAYLNWLIDALQQ